MSEANEKITLLTKDLDSSDIPLSQRIFNFYFLTLKKKSIGLLLLTFFMIFETIELVSYAFVDKFEDLWKITKNSMDYIQLILGVTRITPLMKYLSFDYYMIIFIILISFIFLNFLLFAMTISFNRTESKFYSFSVAFVSYITSNVCVFFLVPISEVMLLMLKCNDENKVDIVKDSVNCFEGLHYLYVILAIIMMILFLCLVILNSIFNFNPFNANNPTTIINPSADTILAIFKILLVILYILIPNDWISILLMILGSLFNMKNAWDSPTYNSYFLQCLVSIRNCSVAWTFLLLIVCRIVKSSNFNGMIYLLVVGYPFIFIISVFYYRHLRNEFFEGKSNNKNASEFLMRVNFLENLIDAFIQKNLSNKNNTGNAFTNLKKKEILLRGQINMHEENCTNEECPLKKFLENQGNFQVQKVSLLHYMNILFNEGIKKFPDSQLILMKYVKFNFDKKYNLNSAKMYLSKLGKFHNSLTEKYVLFFIKKSVALIGNKNGDDEMIRYEDTPQHKFKRFKSLIDNATKLYGEFWGNLATNMASSLNLNKLFYVGNRLNDYLKELNKLWEEFKNKRLELDQQSILQLYCLFIREIMKDFKKSDEIAKKLNEEQAIEIKKENEDKIDINHLEAVLENQDYLFYCRSNDMGQCTIIQCSNSITSLLGYTKLEILGKKIETLMPILCQADHQKMLANRLKNIRVLLNTNNRDVLNQNEKQQKFILMKNKVGYLAALNAKFGVFNDDDFSNTFIIRARMEARDPKVVYAYYILTKNDFTIDSISSSALNLGLSMELLKKHLINLNKLIRSSENEPINVNELLPDFQDDPKEVMWVFPDLIYPKNDVSNNNANNNMGNGTTSGGINNNDNDEKLISESKKKKILLLIRSFKLSENENFGYCFKFTECDNSNTGNSGNGLRKEPGFNMNGFQEFTNIKMLYDIERMNYIRAEIVKEKKTNENEQSKSKDGSYIDNMENNCDKKGIGLSTEENIFAESGIKMDNLSKNVSTKGTKVKIEDDNKNKDEDNSSKNRSEKIDNSSEKENKSIKSNKSNQSNNSKEGGETSKASKSLIASEKDKEKSSTKEDENDNSKKKLEKTTTNGSTESNKSDEESVKLEGDILTKEKILEHQIKTSEEIKEYILGLRFWGKEIFLKKHMPNKELNSVGYPVEPNINISMDDFKRRTDRAVAFDKRSIKKNDANKNGEDSLLSVNSQSNEELNLLTSSTSSLTNYFSVKSIISIKIFALSYFCIILAFLSSEFAVSFVKFNSLNDRVYYSEQAFTILSNLMYCKYFLTEALMVNNNEGLPYYIYKKSNGSYITDAYDKDQFITEQMQELSDYRRNLSNSISMFNNATVSFSKDYHNILDNDQINIFTLTNGKETKEFQPFWTGINRITTSIFIVSTVTSDVSVINITDRNSYELATNLLNDYFIKWKKLTLVLSKEIKKNTYFNFYLVFIFIISFVIVVAFAFLSFNLITKFLNDGTRPIDLIMTIKKSKFEDLKSSCESFMNKLMNKYIGGDEFDDENLMSNSYAIESEDIVMSKFKQRNNYNQSITQNSQFLSIFLGLLFAFFMFEIYFVFKFFYTKTSLKYINNFTDIHNITLYSEVDLILSYNLAKSYFYNSTIPLLNDNDTDKVFKESITSLSDSIENLIKITYKKMNYIDNNYLSFFYNHINNNITYVNDGGYTVDDFYGTMIYGFKALILRYFELIRYTALEYFSNYYNKNDIYKNADYAEASVLIKNVIRNWYLLIKNQLSKSFERYYNKIKLVNTSVFIVYLFLLIILYFLVWKTIEDRMENYIKSSIDLINLIPEEMKVQMVIKLNEEEERENNKDEDNK